MNIIEPCQSQQCLQVSMGHMQSWFPQTQHKLVREIGGRVSRRSSNRIPHAISADVCLYQCNLAEIGRDGRNRRLFIVPVSREAEQRIIDGLRIVMIKIQSMENGTDVIISLKLPRYKLFHKIRQKLDNCKIIPVWLV